MHEDSGRPPMDSANLLRTRITSSFKLQRRGLPLSYSVLRISGAQGEGEGHERGWPKVAWGFVLGFGPRVR